MTKYTVGQIVKFAGYAEAPPEILFHPGDFVKIMQANPDESYVAAKCDAQGNLVDPQADADTLFDMELGEVVVPAAQIQTAQIPVPRPPARREPAAEVAQAETATTEETQAEEAQTEEAPAKPAKAAAKKKAVAKKKAAAETAPKPAATPAKTTGKTAAKAAGKAKAETAAKAAAKVGETASGQITTVEAFDPAKSELVRAALDSVMTSDDANEGAAALVAAKSLIGRVDQTYYTLGGVLSYIKQEGSYKSLGYAGKRGFQDYMKAELGIDYRRGQGLIAIFERTQRAGVDESRLLEIGWSKAAQIIRVGQDVSLEALRDHWHDLIDYAASHTRDELTGHIKTSFSGISTRQDERVRKTTFTFALSAEAGENAVAALAVAKNLCGTDDPSDAFSYIMNDWRMMTENVQLDPAEEIRRLGERLGVRLVIAETALADAASVAAE